MKKIERNVYGKEIGQMKKLKTTRMDMHFEEGDDIL